MSEDKDPKAELLNDLKQRRDKILEMGGEDRIAAQTKKGKLTARQRIDDLLDEGSFHETGIFVKSRGAGSAPADAVVTGYGKIDDRVVFIYAQDFTSTGGTMSEMQSKKICEVMDRAIASGHPIISLNDSGGARIQDGVDSLSAYGQLFYRNVTASGVVPQICAILGPTAGGGVYSPALMDFMFMVKGISYAFITGPRVVKQAIGQDVSEEELGGAVAAQQKAGVVCRSENSEAECFAHIRELLSYLPASNREMPPWEDWGDSPGRTDETLFDVVPANLKRPYDMRKIIASVFDQRGDGKSNFFELFPLFAPNIITGFSRLDGHSVGIVANQPMQKAGALDIDACDKASRFIRFCDAFDIPIVNLVDVPGYLPGTDQEWGGIIRHGAKMLYAYSEATVPKLTLTLRKAYGGSYLGMCNKDMGADTVLCWPSTVLAVMDAEGAAPIIFRRELADAENPDELLQQKIKEYRDEFANPYRAAEHLHVDDVIDPAETRPRLIAALEMSLGKEEERPARKHGIMPT